ncbi:response regulator [Paracoccus laeviglucosivorans]|uniref:histidine kinase n=1 Tax=Paracoccus laeviglucosivorans TaxID=1197861 RepID=A0A521EPQ9_9RHOB|nr:response regulator [Paracoccus laeviglucosivorans]SMO85908.1 PAS domain S-box-containing protein [Paracoccus laeviglucosivorans]
MQNDPIRVLIVDDIHENLLAVEAVLRRNGLIVDLAQSAQQALELMLIHPYALALLDVQMPDIDGFELAELMRGAERTRDIPIIFLTAADRDEQRRFRGYEAGAVDFIFKPLNPVILKSKAEIFFRIGRQASQLQRQRDELRMLADHRDRAIRQLKAHADNSPVALIELDPSLRVESWSKGAERLFGLSASQITGRSLSGQSWLPAAAIQVLLDWISIGRAEPQHRAEFELTDIAGQDLCCEVYGSVLHGATGQVSLSLQLLDVTERRRAEKLRMLLVGELNHRVKNTLANVQAIARQTLRQSGDLAGFASSFDGRLQALARAHALLSDMTWESASLDQLVDEQIRLGTLDPQRLDRNGPAVQLSPEGALRMALCLHELGTNATKYGALSAPDGRISLTWQVQGDWVRLIWQEQGGPSVTAPGKTGFGSALIAAGAVEDEGAVVEWLPTGVVWKFSLPIADLKHPPRASGAEEVAAAAPLPVGSIAGSRVLVIEDEPLVAMDIRQELQNAGVGAINVARSVRQALAHVQTAQIDIALLDGNLGGERVDEVAAALRGRGIPFCFVSGYGRDQLPQEFTDTPIVEKPFRTDSLIPVLNTLICTRTG